MNIKTILKVINYLFQYLVSGITAPIMYPVWYLFRNKIKDILDIEEATRLRKTTPELVKDYIISNTNIWVYWLWLYGENNYKTGDMSPTWLLINRGFSKEDQLLLTQEFKDKILEEECYNNFWYRYRWSALRNPRYNYNYLYYKSGVIKFNLIVLDNRTDETVPMVGFGDPRIGTYYAKLRDEDKKEYFIYEKTTKWYHFSFGWSGLMNNPIDKRGTFGTTFRFVKKGK